jgi:GT2 family glycosyltransferase/glycosyltransferase involved in cell wall biosynthesis/SAM-dependent methyltransferase
MHVLPNEEQYPSPDRKVLSFPRYYLERDGLFTPIIGRPDRIGEDGEIATDERIAGIVASLIDRSSLSPELRAAITDWPTQYHLSAKRANLLRPFAEQLRGRRVVEIGAGYGAITRFLGETAREVLAVESDARRAETVRARTRDLANVAVIHDDLFGFSLDEPADVVLLIGVLEYAGVFFPGQDEPERALLAHLTRLLKPDGLLLLATENRLGLKNLAGALPDPIGAPLIATAANAARFASFAKTDLQRMLRSVGFSLQDLYLPFPDYKSPSVIISPLGIATRGFDPGALAAETVHTDPQPPLDPAFSLQRAWPVIAHNNLLADMSNAFLVAARLARPAETEPTEGILAWHYALDRQPSFMKEAIFVKQDEAIHVRRRPLTLVAAPSGTPIVHANPEEAYLPTRSWWFRLIEIFGLPGWTLAEVTAWANIWIEALLARIGQSPLSAETLVEGTHFDATPFNLAVPAEGPPIFFDQEWQVRAALPLGFVLVRSLRESVRRVEAIAPPADPALDTVDRIVTAILTDLGFLITPSDLARYSELELMVQTWVGGKLLPEHKASIGHVFQVPLRWHVPTARPRRLARVEALEAQLRAAAAALSGMAEQSHELNRLSAEAARLAEDIGRRETAARTQRAETLLLAGNVNRLRVTERRAQRQWREAADQLDAASERLAAQEVRLAALAGYEQTVATIYASTTWRLVSRLNRIAERHPDISRGARGAAKLVVWTARGKLFSRLGQRRAMQAAAALATAERLPAPMPIRAPQSDPKEALATRLQAALRDFLDTGERLVLPIVEKPRLSILIVLFNKAYFTLGCLRALAHDLEPGTEIILQNNGSTDETAALLDRIDNARILCNGGNLGFLRGANAAAAAARGEFLLFLNNDAFVHPGSIAAALAVLGPDAATGAVVGRLIHPDQRLQEAGAIVWRDGITEGYARGRPADAAEAMFRRVVDYGSGAFLMTRREAFERLGGFDQRYAPAYYEDSDYCLRLREIGLATVYEPMASADHFEFGSQTASGEAEALMHRNRRRFRARHGAALAGHLPAIPANRLAARVPPGAGGRRVLVLEERVPHRPYGAGFPRLLSVLDGMIALGWSVTLLPLDEPEIDWEGAYTELDPRVEILSGGLDALTTLRQERSGFYEVLFISRPNNMQRFRDFAATSGLDLSGTRIVYDAEAFAALREIARRKLQGEAATTEEAAALIDAEAALAAGVESVTAVSEAEAALFRAHVAAPAYVLGDTVNLSIGDKNFAERDGFLFVGRLLETDSPNYDSLRWFVQEIWPALRAMLGDVTLTVAGALSAGAPDLAAPGVELLGQVDDLEPLYAGARIFIAPTRFAAGLPHKVVEAAAAGLPTVATSLIAGQMGWRHGEEIMSADRPEDFAQSCASLYEGEALWRRVRDGGQARIAAEHSQARFIATLAAVLDGSGQS